MPNRLADESSPYLIQHQDNPVDWYPWGPEAIGRAKDEDRPIFLSIGYSACHWCHVMEHESFENPEIADKLNRAFVCIKVDREERPDLDQIYMNAVQMLTGHGGWPMSMFLTPELKPFFGGTYWPPTARGGMTGFDEILSAVAQAWQHRREQALDGADQLTKKLQEVGSRFAGDDFTGDGELNRELLEASQPMLNRAFDPAHGGFGMAPKFPHPMDLQLLLRLWRRNGRESTLDMVRLTLDKMAAGGIYDHLGGGFARYSVDARWLVPHFEKMLYDNALLVVAYLDGYLATGEQRYARVVRETLDYVLRDMTDADGAFYSTEDADSEGVEGKFYVWTLGELQDVLGDEVSDDGAATTFARMYDVTEEGNFEDKNILNLPKTFKQCAAILERDEQELVAELATSRTKLLAARERRVRPGRDDKVLLGWNSLMIDAMARAGAALDEPRYVEAATKACDFILTSLRRDDGRLLHTWRHGAAKLDAYLDDYAGLANALVSVYEATFDESRIDEAVRLADLMLSLFHDSQAGGFFYTAVDHERLIARTKDLTDSSVPSGNGLAALVLLRLGRLTGRSDFWEAAVSTLQAAAPVMRQAPTAAGQMLQALDMYLGPTHEIVVAGNPQDEETKAVLADLRGRFVPNKVVAMRNAKADTASDPAADRKDSAVLDPLFAGKQGGVGDDVGDDDGPTVYVCENFACQSPVTGRQAIVAKWAELSSLR